MRELSDELGLIAGCDEKYAEHLEALLDAIDKDLRRASRIAKAKAARSSTLDENLAQIVRLVEAEIERRARAVCWPRNGRGRRRPNG